MSASRSQMHAGVARLGVKLLNDAPRLPRSADGLAHILLMVDQFARVMGGGERVLLRNAGLLLDAGYRVSILTFSIDPQCEAISSAPCPVYLLPVPNVFSPAALGAAWRLGRFLRRERVRIVETFFESSNLFGGIVTRALSGARLVWNRRDMGILRGAKHTLAYKALRHLPHHVVAVSEKVRSHAIHFDHIPPDRTTVIYNGIPLERWNVAQDMELVAPASELVAPASELRCVTIGNLRHVKGHDLLVEAAAVLVGEFPGVRFEFAGEILEHAFASTLRKRIAELGLESHIVFSGNVTDLPACLHGAALCVQPSRSEGFSNALIEAMAAALPVVATDVGGNAEAVLDGVTGTIVPAENITALVAALRPMLARANLRRDLGRAGRLRVESLFSEAAMKARICSLYRRLLTPAAKNVQ
jgi:glycosyltransferase involved in cell wall biosynthesis